MDLIRRTIVVGLAAIAAAWLFRCAEHGTIVLGTCGDGVQDPGEACEDGNLVDGDGCSSLCTVEEPSLVLPTLASIQRKIFTPICSACHFPQGTGQFMPLHDEVASYESLVLAGYSFLCRGPRVDPGNPDDSCLVLKVEGSDQAGGEPMPPRPAPRLTDGQIGAIREWIRRGASP
jgi:cysteine-rich repeat protein